MKTVGLEKLDWCIIFPAVIYLQYETKANKIRKNAQR
jgi:hypothetical protein